MLVKKATIEQLDSTCETLAHAFSEDPVIKYMFPSNRNRLSKLYIYFKLYTEVANIKDYGHILTTDDSLGAFVAFTHKGITSKEFNNIKKNLFTIFGKDARKILSLTNCLENYHPPQKNYYYAALLGIRKEVRRQFYGIDLIKNYHSILDNSSTASYAECTSIKSKALLEKLGYVDYGKPIFVAKNCPVLYPVWRPALETVL